MKLQFTSLVSLAVFCGSVTATPIPAEATDAALGTIGSLLGTAYQAVASSSALNGAADAVGARLPGQYEDEYRPGGPGGYRPGYPRDVVSEDADPSVSDALLRALGGLLGTAYEAVAPQDALESAVGAAGARLSSQFRRDVASEDAVPSISDAVLGTIGNLLGTAYQAVAPSAALGGAADAVGARLPGNRGRYRYYYSRDVASEDAVPSVSDALLRTIGSLLGTAYEAVAPSAALHGSADAVGARLPFFGRDDAPDGDDDDDNLSLSF